jgi:dienelactone hydrolase
MKRYRRLSKMKVLNFEQCEGRILPTLVFVLNGNDYGAAKPSDLTAHAARVLQKAGNQAIQLSTPELATTGAFYSLVKKIDSLSHGQPIGIVGFSAGGTLAARLAGVKTLHVTAALAYYSPPDLRDYLNFHRGDRYYRSAVGHVHFTSSAINLLSGPSDTSAYVVSAFGLYDHNVVASESTASFRRDFPHGQVYYYPGPHGVSINASYPALEDFLTHL